MKRASSENQVPIFLPVIELCKTVRIPLDVPRRQSLGTAGPWDPVLCPKLARISTQDYPPPQAPKEFSQPGSSCGSWLLKVILAINRLSVVRLWVDCFLRFHRKNTVSLLLIRFGTWNTGVSVSPRVKSTGKGHLDSNNSHLNNSREFIFILAFLRLAYLETQWNSSSELSVPRWLKHGPRI